eukprot:348386_1
MITIIFIMMLDATIGQWIQSNIRLPRHNSFMAAGYYNKSIYLLGGLTSYQMIEYDVQQNIFVDNGVSALNDKTYGSGQYYNQIGNLLYIIDSTNTENINKTLTVFNLESKTFDHPYWNGIDSQIAAAYDGCIASSNDRIFIFGGKDNNNAFLGIVQILYLSTNAWSSYTLTMNQERNEFSCIVHQPTDTLYAIGGNECNNCYLSSIEKIKIINIENEAWQYNINSLSSPAKGTRSVIYGNSIFVVGGYYWSTQDRDNYLNTVNIIDAISGTVSLGDSLAFGAQGIAAIIVNNILYAFAGYNADNIINENSGNALNKWQYYTLPPTNEPTVSPTGITAIPVTTAPTSIPTTTPTTQQPTFLPTTQPTSFPTTTSPTISEPTQTPTKLPT